MIHPNLATTYEVGFAEGRVFAASEYLAGESLSSIFAALSPRDPPPVSFALQLLRECAQGLHHAHHVRDSKGGGPIHGDICPGNLFLTFEGKGKLLGFGLGRTPLDVRFPANEMGPHNSYVSPEDIESGTVDARSDVFSLGAVFWECLTGTPLFGGSSIPAALDAVRSRYIEPPGVLRSDLPSGVDEVALRALSRDPRRRYQTAAEFAQAIENVLSGMESRPGPADSAAWLVGLVGDERARLKKQINEGTAVEATLARLRLHGEARRQSPPPSATAVAPTASPPPAPPATPPTKAADARPVTPILRLPTSPQAPPTAVDPTPNDPGRTPARAWPAATPTGQPAAATPTTTEPRSATAPSSTSRPPTAKLAIAGIAVGVLGVGLLLFFSLRTDGTEGSESGQRSAAAPVGILQVQSTPSGAQVLIDGDPSGLATPARLSGLLAGRRVEIRVDKSGYNTAKQTVEVPSGAPRVVSFVLEESNGSIRLEGIPAQANTFVDDVATDTAQPVSLSVGPHRLRIEVGGRLFASQTLDVKPGERVVRVQPTAGTEK